MVLHGLDISMDITDMALLYTTPAGSCSYHYRSIKLILTHLVIMYIISLDVAEMLNEDRTGRQDLSNRAVQLKMRLRSDLVNCTKYNIKTKIVELRIANLLL